LQQHRQRGAKFIGRFARLAETREGIGVDGVRLRG
jgi:hypothetical protein